MTSSQLGIVFPGQGSQSVGMLADIAPQYSVVQETFAEASAVLGYDLWQLSQVGPADELNKTVHTQPALLTASIAIWRILQQKKLATPAMLAGHSLGEYSALVCANAIDFVTAVQLVAARGQYMQEAVAAGVGAMAAIIGLDEKAVVDICQQAVRSGEVLTPANYNSIGQVVIAGHKQSVDRAIVIANEQGARMAMLIPVSVPSHCALMKPAAERLEALLSTITLRQPMIPVLNNADVAFYRDAASIREGLVKQLYMPVRWVEVIQTFKNDGVTKIIECGAGRVLTGLNKRIDKELQLMVTADLASIEALTI